MGKRDFTNDIVRVLVESLGKGKDEEQKLSKRQVALRVKGPLSTVFEELQALEECGFVVLEECRTERGTRPYVTVRLGLLGCLYALHFYNLALKEEEKNKIFKDAYREIQNFLNQNSQIFDADPWSKLCFKATLSLGEAAPLSFQQRILENIAKSIFDGYVTPQKPITLRKVKKLCEDKSRLFNSVVKGLLTAYREMMLERLIEKDEKVCMEAFSKAFRELKESEKKAVIGLFKHEYDSLMNRFVRKLKLPKKIRREFMRMCSKTSQNEVICIFKCPRCEYTGLSKQNIEELLSSYTVRCPKCGTLHKLTSLPKYFSEENVEVFSSWATGLILHQLTRASTSKPVLDF